ncbi:MAG: deoxyribodipyrimidine photo-lyase [Hellea sp.]|nr:deoxyribodipyrimidine photo-lyase [Hellea sp.]
MSNIPIIVWFRRDLRTADNPALFEAAKTGAPILPLFIDEEDLGRPLGAASKVWLHHSLKALKDDLGDLVIRRGKASAVIDALIEETGAIDIYWNRRYQKADRDRDGAIMDAYKFKPVEVNSFNGNLLSEPWEIKTKSGTKNGQGYYKVFTPYWRAAREQMFVAEPMARPNFKLFKKMPSSLSVDDLGLLPDSPDWASKMMDDWTMGEAGAVEALEDFLDGPIASYASDRDRPDKPQGTSRLSPHLAFGEISPRQIWHAVKNRDVDGGKFLSEIGWREFSYALLYYNPDLATKSFRPEYDAFPWVKNDDALHAWQMGQTGYPFVDAGMRQLWETGYQHNRVRMITASFLIKHLMINWREGERWFWDCLFDADPANNAASWQWVAGSGADASPYFRIFNPYSQGEKFDKNGDYVRKWVPELSELPNKFIHRPWEAPKSVLEDAGVTLGKSYPKPIVDHKAARERALSAYKELKNAST